jgi:hypothetical protein
VAERGQVSGEPEHAWTHEALATDIAGSIRSPRVSAVLSKLIRVHGTPHYLRSDNGSEFVAAPVLRWVHDEGLCSGSPARAHRFSRGSEQDFARFGMWRERQIDEQLHVPCRQFGSAPVHGLRIKRPRSLEMIGTPEP